RQRTAAEDGERQRVAQLARDQVQRLRREAAELVKADKLEEALARLAQASAAAAALDPQVQRQIKEESDKLRAELLARKEEAARVQRVEELMAEGLRLLGEGKATDATVRFDDVLARDPGNVRAQEGKRAAQDLIISSRTKEALATAFREGRALFDAGRYEDAIRPLTDAAADPENAD